MPMPAPSYAKVGDFPGSSREEIEQEPDWSHGHNHRTGFRNNQDRFAGLTHDEDHWASEEELREIEEALKKHREFREAQKAKKLLNFQDIMHLQTDFASQNPGHYPATWRFVVRATEEFVKQQQDWPANIESRKRQESAAKQQDNSSENKKSESESGNKNGERKEKSNGEEQTSDDEDDQKSHNDEDNWRRDRGHEKSNKHNNAYSEQQNLNHRSDKSYEQLRKKFTPQEISFLQALEHERDYVKTLEQNDGDIISPVRVDKSESGKYSIDKQDTMTPDNWIPRSSELIRRTGQHPLNAEPKLTDLFAAGLITPNALHYVRNHGPVPRLSWETHNLDICEGTVKMSMNELVERFKPINICMAMACDGNRRGELNKLKKSKGFDWGAGAISNAYWKGARLCEVLAYAGVDQTALNGGHRRFVNFEGADELSEGKYATSIPLDYALDPQNDIILAYEMNNTPLPADHGFPVRLIIPGFVGGRCVKWLARIWLSDYENESYYHIWDNRVLPAFVTEKDGEFARVMFNHPDTACNEQNLNSVIVRPAQGEKLDPKTVLSQKTYRIAGYAYDGAGHEVQRVEVSIDDGETWLYAIREYPKKPLRHGNKFWSWCHWRLDIDSFAIMRARTISVRAFNVFKNTQPSQAAWNIMGMMNNCWYQVKLSEDQDGNAVMCRHPFDPEADDGWMKPSTENQLAAAKQNSGVPDKQFTRQEVEKHNHKDDCWLVVNGIVYDVTSVLSWHPGGSATILANCGKLSTNVTTSFESIHDDYAHKKLQECAIGQLTDKAMEYMQQSAKDEASAAARKDSSSSKVMLQSTRWQTVKLTNRKKLTEDTYRYTFEYKSTEGAKSKLGLGTCQHIQLGIHMKDKMLVRSYTPTRPIFENEDDGSFDVVLKTYYPDDNQPGGAFSNFLYALPLGESIEVSGPTGEIEYQANGTFIIEGQEYHFDKVNLILGGSGVTPGYQLIRKILGRSGENSKHKDQTQIRVIDANKTEADILLKDEFDALEKEHATQFKIAHVLSHPQNASQWQGEKGHVDAQIIRKHLFGPDYRRATANNGEKGNGEAESESTVICLLCGPPSMIQKAALPALKDWGFVEEKDVFGF